MNLTYREMQGLHENTARKEPSQTSGLSICGTPSSVSSSTSSSSSLQHLDLCHPGVVQLELLHPGAGQLLDGPHQADVLRRDEAHGAALPPSARRPAHTVHVILLKKVNQ